MKLKNRIKYYRDLLNVTQDELGCDSISRNYISLLESNKRKLTINTASILVNNFNNIAKKKGIDLNITLKDLMETKQECAERILKQRINELELSGFDKDAYIDVLNTAREYGLDDILIKVLLNLGEYYYKEGKINASIEYLKSALKEGEDVEKYTILPDILLRLGSCYYLLEEYDIALICLENGHNIIIKTNQEDLEVCYRTLFNLALALNKLERYEEALIHIDKLLEFKNLNNSFEFRTQLLRANIYAKLNDNERALEIYKMLAAQKHDDLYLVYYNIATVYVNMGQVEEGIKFYEKSIKIQLESQSEDITGLLIGTAQGYSIKEDFKISKIYYGYAIQNAIKFKQVNEIVTCFEDLLGIYKSQRDSKLLEQYEGNMLEYLCSKDTSTSLKYRINLILTDYYMESNQLEKIKDLLIMQREGIFKESEVESKNKGKIER